jgi:FkbM family methyltransferase
MATATSASARQVIASRRIEADERAASVIAEFDSRRRSGRYDRLPAHHQPFEEPYVVRHEVAGVQFDILIANENAMHWYEDPDHRISATAVHCGEFAVIQSLELVRPGDVVLDCGAHHGVIAGMVAKVVGPRGHVYAFEPSLIGCDLVELNAALNGLDNVTAVRAAVNDRRGSARFNERAARLGSDHFDSVEVPRIVLDDYAGVRPRLVKIDVEGAEGAVLAGARLVLESTPNLMLEVHPDRMILGEGTTQESVVAQVDWSRYRCFQGVGARRCVAVDRPRLPKEGGWLAARRRSRAGAALHRVRRLGQPRRADFAPAAPAAERAVAEAGGIKYDLAPLPHDPLADTIRGGHVPGGPSHDAVVRAAGPATRVLDLGARIGSTALHAVSAGAEVVAVEADPAYVASLRASAGLNGLELDVLHAVAGESSGALVYSPAGPWGHVRKVTEIDDVSARMEVSTLPGDELLARAGWDGAELIKLTLSGFEPFALRGLSRTLRGPRAPKLLVIECSAHALTWYGNTPQDLRRQLAELGYKSFIVDRLRPQRLIPTAPAHIQPQCVSTLLAARDTQTLLDLGYEVQALSKRKLAERLLLACAAEGATDRWHAVREIERGPAWLREEPEIAAAVEQLHRDPVGMVRDAAWWANEATVGADAAEPVASRPQTTTMEVPGAGRVSFVLPAGPADPVVRELVLRDEYPPFAPNQLLLAMLRPDMTFLDLGANVGTFALPAAALGARVVAVDAHPQHAQLLAEAAASNGFEDRMTVVHAAIADQRGEVDLICHFGWSFVEPPAGAPQELAAAKRVRVRALPTRDVLAEAGVSRVDFIKIDMEGAEPLALAGMTELLEAPDAPPVLFEVNIGRLQELGCSVRALAEMFTRVGYRLYKLEESDDERLLVPITPDVFLPDPSDDLLAAKREPELCGWRVTEPLSRHDQVDRAVQTARSPFRQIRGSLACRLKEAPPWLLRDPLIREALRALRHDVHRPVRQAAGWSALLD